MTVINVGSARSDVDIESELRQFSWNKPRWTVNKLIASSPFRDDFAPSFFVNLETGGWADSGAYGTEYEKGNFVKLLAYLRNETEESTAQYLADKYGVIGEITPDKPIRVPTPKLRTRVRHNKPLNVEITPAISPYLSSRGISPTAQKRYGIGYNERHRGFTAIPWHNEKGEIANVKYRSTRNKRFFYEAGGTSVTELVYGLYQAKGSEYIIVCEGEIDVLSWATAGYNAVALGGAHISDRQAYLIAKGGFERVYLAGDSDEQGRNLNRRVSDKLRGKAELFEINYGNEKDANDLLQSHGVEGLVEIYDRAQTVRSVNLSRPE